jgi:ribonuclease HI
MKTIKLDHELANRVIARKMTSTWRLFDDKDLSVDDRVVLIDKMDPHNHDTWKAFGEAVINQVTEKHLGEIGKDDYDGHERFSSTEEMLKTYRKYYGESVSLKTPVKIIHFTFFPYTEQPAVPNRAVETTLSANEVKLYADGGSRGNPGPSASGYVLFDTHDGVLVDKGVYLGITTNNQAEYTALKLGLEEALAMGVKTVHVYMDSLLVVNQMKGVFKVKNRDLWPIHEAIKELVTKFQEVKFTHVPRELNKAADAAVNRALDAHISDGDERTVV